MLKYCAAVGETTSREGGVHSSELTMGAVEGGTAQVGDERRVFQYPRLSRSGRLAAEAQANALGGVAEARRGVKRRSSPEATNSKRAHGTFREGFHCKYFKIKHVVFIQLFLIFSLFELPEV